MLPRCQAIAAKFSSARAELGRQVNILDQSQPSPCHRPPMSPCGPVFNIFFLILTIPQAKLAATNLSGGSEEASEGEIKSGEDEDDDGYLKKMQEIISGGEGDNSSKSSLKEEKAEQGQDDMSPVSGGSMSTPPDKSGRQFNSIKIT